MRKILIFVVLTATSLSALSQAGTTSLKAHYLRIYNQSLTYNDVGTAIGALHGYLAEDNSLKYKDTLSMLYFSSKSYVSSLIVAEEVFKADNGNVIAMARAAECYDELGDPKTSVLLFEQVTPKTKNPYHYYKLAIGQFQLKRIGECEATAKIVIADTASKSIGVNFLMEDGNQQTVPINAAAVNLLGVIQMDLKNYAAAKPYFTQALTLFPAFSGAKQNLAVCDRNLKPVKPKG